MILIRSKKGESKVNQQLMVMIESKESDCGKPFTSSLCMIRHKAALLRQARGIAGYNDCTHCPLILEYIKTHKTVEHAEPPAKALVMPIIPKKLKGEKKAVKPKAKETLICTECDRPAKHKKSGLCHKHYNKAWYAKNSEKAAATNAKCRKNKKDKKAGVLGGQLAAQVKNAETAPLTNYLLWEQLKELSTIAGMMKDALLLASKILQGGNESPTSLIKTGAIIAEKLPVSYSTAARFGGKSA